MRAGSWTVAGDHAACNVLPAVVSGSLTSTDWGVLRGTTDQDRCGREDWVLPNPYTYANEVSWI